MKKILSAVLIATTLFACTNAPAKKEDNKALLDDIMKMHEKVMASDEKLNQNKMKLDTLLKLPNLAAKDTAAMLSAKLIAADDAMANWMHKFDPDQTGKSDKETESYMSSQKKQILAIDSQINAALAQSNKYLLKVKSK